MLWKTKGSAQAHTLESHVAARVVLQMAPASRSRGINLLHAKGCADCARVTFDKGRTRERRERSEEGPTEVGRPRPIPNSYYATPARGIINNRKKSTIDPSTSICYEALRLWAGACPRYQGSVGMMTMPLAS